MAGIAITAGALLWVAAPLVIIIGGIGAVSVIKAVYIDKCALKCACVRGQKQRATGVRFVNREPDDAGYGIVDAAQNDVIRKSNLGGVGGSVPPSRNSSKPSSAGWIDRSGDGVQMFGMELRNTISGWLNAFACFAFAFALVFFPPSASHAASGMHGDHHSVSVSSNHGAGDHIHAEQPSDVAELEFDSISTNSDEEQISGQCCSGICLSVALTENGTVLVDLPTTGIYLMPDAQTRSVVASGFLRPPQFLI